jgi:hypothetical protein
MKNFRIVIVLIIVLVSCRPLRVEIKGNEVYYSEYYFNTKILRRGKVFRYFNKRFDCEGIIKFEPSKKTTFYQVFSTCDHCRTDEFYYFTKNDSLIKFEDSLFRNDKSLYNFINKYSADTVLNKRVIEKMKKITSKNNTSKGNF